MNHARDAEQFDEEKLLQLCPWCRYKLRGLPIEHHCPECGEAFDRRWQVFGGKSIPRKSLRAARPITVLMILVLVWMAGSALLSITLGKSMQGAYPVVACCVPLALAVAAYYSYPVKAIVLAPEGVISYERKTKIVFYAWETIGRARYDVNRGAIALPVGDDTVRFYTFPHFRWLVFEADRCVRAINAYPRELVAT